MKSFTVHIRPRWWVFPYLHTLAFLCAAMRTEPDLEKVGGFIGKYGIKIILKEIK